jgi:hypothetical protein
MKSKSGQVPQQKNNLERTHVLMSARKAFAAAKNLYDFHPINGRAKLSNTSNSSVSKKNTQPQTN